IRRGIRLPKLTDRFRGLSWTRGSRMLRRLGNLGIGTLLAAGLATGCVTTGGSANDAHIQFVHPPDPQPADPALLKQPSIAQTPRENHPDLLDPPSLPEPEILRVADTVRPPSLPSAQIAFSPAEPNESAIITALRSVVDKRPAEALEALRH